jgi:hypothetical protein
MSSNGIYLCEGCGIGDAISIDGLEKLAGELGVAIIVFKFIQGLFGCLCPFADPLRDCN